MQRCVVLLDGLPVAYGAFDDTYAFVVLETAMNAFADTLGGCTGKPVTVEWQDPKQLEFPPRGFYS